MRIDPKQAVCKLLSGGVVALPTETVYGLAASVHHPKAIQRVFELKKRPSDNPLIIHIANLEQLKPFIKGYPPGFERLVKAYWPGSLTLVLEADEENVPEVVRGGLPTVAVRMPKHPEVFRVLSETGPLVMPSANLSGRPSATSAEHVVHDFGDAVFVLDGGNCEKGVESTILMYADCKWRIGRQGAVTKEELAVFLGGLFSLELASHAKKPLCPGQLYRHYAPKAKLLPFFLKKDTQGIVVGFNDREYPEALCVYRLGSLSDPSSIANSLYRVLRQLDLDGVKEAWVDWDFPDEGLWRTIRERLEKAGAF